MVDTFYDAAEEYSVVCCCLPALVISNRAVSHIHANSY